MDLIWMRIVIKDSFGRVDRVGYDNDFGDIVDGACLIDTASNSKKFGFRTCYEGSMMNCFDNWLIE